jgi:hypothetical protein
VLTTEVSILNVSAPFIIFCNLVSKAMARTLIHEPGKMVRVCNDPSMIKANLQSSPQLRAEWSRILVHYAAFGWPPQGLTPVPEPIAQVTRILILRAIEWFALAHEYGHHVMKHAEVASSDAQINHLDQEHEADIFAMAVSMGLGTREEVMNFYAISGVGGVIILGMLDLVRRAKATLETGVDDVAPRGTHPSFSDRIDAIAVDQLLPQRYQQPAADMRACFVTIIETIWGEAFPILRELHNRGLRPHVNVSDSGGWLPS